jgi:APA family basic amino acid/polyamine antiporter
VAVSFTYGGYQQSINFGEEVKEPAKNIPKGIFFGLLIIIALYLTINYAYYKVIGFEGLKSSTNIAAIMASHVFGSAAGNILSILLFLSVLAYVNVLLMSNPRVMQAMSEEGVLPKTFGKRTVNTNVLLTSLSVFASLCALIVFWAKTFDEILSFTIFLDCFGMVLSAATIFKLRKQTAHLDNTGIYKMKLYPLLPLIFMSAYAFVAVSIFMDKPWTALTGLGILGRSQAFILL